MNNGDGFSNTKTYPITFSSLVSGNPTIVCMGLGTTTTLTDATIKTPYTNKFEWLAWVNGAAATTANSVGMYYIAIGF